MPGHVHLNKVAAVVKQAVRAAGGVPFEFNTIAVCDGIAMGHTGMKYSLASREIVADSVETMVKAHCFDGLICIPNCDKIIPGMLMAAVRLNVPTIFVSGGPMPAGKTKDGRTVDLISIFEGVAEYNAGKINEEALDELETRGFQNRVLNKKHVFFEAVRDFIIQLSVVNIQLKERVMGIEPT